MNQTDRIKKFGSSPTIFMEGRRGLETVERTLSHTSTRVSTSAKAVRKIKGRRIRGMKVLAHIQALPTE